MKDCLMRVIFPLIATSSFANPLHRPINLHQFSFTTTAITLPPLLLFCCCCLSLAHFGHPLRSLFEGVPVWERPPQPPLHDQPQWPPVRPGFEASGWLPPLGLRGGHFRRQATAAFTCGLHRRGGEGQTATPSKAESVMNNIYTTLYIQYIHKINTIWIICIQYIINILYILYIYCIYICI